MNNPGSQVVATGHAAQKITKVPAAGQAQSEFAVAFARASIGVESEKTVERRRRLIAVVRKLPANESAEVLQELGMSAVQGLSPDATLRGEIGRAREGDLAELERVLLPRESDG